LAALTTTAIPLAGLRFDTLFTAVSASDDCETGDGILLLVKNGNAGACTVTLVTPELVDGDLAVADRVVSVPATVGYTAIKVTSRYRDPTTGRATVTFSPTATVTACVVRI
jgi:hypothetical protein